MSSLTVVRGEQSPLSAIVEPGRRFRLPVVAINPDLWSHILIQFPKTKPQRLVVPCAFGNAILDCQSTVAKIWRNTSFGDSGRKIAKSNSTALPSAPVCLLEQKMRDDRESI